MSQSPNFTEEELVLVLDTYFEIGPENISADHPKVQRLSRVLRRLPIHAPEDRPSGEAFRPPNGIRGRLAEFRRIDEGTNRRSLNTYQEVRDRYKNNRGQLREDACAILRKYGLGGSGAGTPNGNVETARSVIQEERALREEMWEELISRGGPSGMPASLLRELGMYRGQAGIWVDKARTASLTPDKQGITVSVLHTGSTYADDLDEEGVLYHYPDTRRPGSRDQSEIEATKNAGRHGVPLFVITYPDPDSTERDVHWGRVEDWDDEAQIFLIEFGRRSDSQLRLPLDAGRDEKLLGAGASEEPFQLTGSSEASTTRQKARPGQRRFAFRVFKRYGRQCAVCNVQIKAMLDACHLRGKEHSGSDHPGNGLVLCANHHRAFDGGLFAIEPETLTIQIAPGHSAEELLIRRSSLAHLPRPPHPKAIRWRWQQWDGA